MGQTVLPGVSLAMTVLNESQSLPAFLDSIASQGSLPSEVLVVDGGSTDGTLELLGSWQPPEGVEMTVISAPGANISAGRNLAIAASTGSWIAITDAGTTLDREWLSGLFAQMRDDVDVVAGWFEPSRGGFRASTIATVITPLLAEIQPNTFLPSSRSIALRKTAWLAAGGYPEWLDYCEDLVFDLAMKSAGSTFAFAPNAKVSWGARPTFRAFYKQYYRYARGDGKAGLWPKRHLIRYGAYLMGAALLATAVIGHPVLPIALLAMGTATYFGKFWRRAWSRRGTLLDRPIRSLFLTPAVVVTGDIAKMVGYPVGLAWRIRSRRSADG